MGVEQIKGQIKVGLVIEQNKGQMKRVGGRTKQGSDEEGWG